MFTQSVTNECQMNLYTLKMIHRKGELRQLFNDDSGKNI